MTPENAFRAAIESHDYAAAKRTLEQYAAWIRSAPRTPGEIAAATSVLEGAIGTVRAARNRMATELAFIGERAPEAAHTWQLDA